MGLSPLLEDDVHRFIGRDMLGHLKAQRIEIDPGKKRLAAPKQDRRHRQMHLVDEIGFEILPDRRDAAANPDVAAARCLSRALQRLMRSEEHTSELQSLMRISYDVFCL